jgi:hypothetical protein
MHVTGSKVHGSFQVWNPGRSQEWCVKKERVAGIFEVGLADDAEGIIIRHPDFKPDATGTVHIVLSPRHARHLLNSLTIRIEEAESRQAQFHKNSSAAASSASGVT